MVPRSAPYNYPVWPHSSLLWPRSASYSPLQEPHSGGEPMAIQKQDKYQNDQHARMSAVIPKLTLYDCPIQAPFKPLMAPFKIPLQPHSEKITSPYQHHKIHQNVQLNKQRKMHPLRPPEHS